MVEERKDNNKWSDHVKRPEHWVLPLFLLFLLAAESRLISCQDLACLPQSPSVPFYLALNWVQWYMYPCVNFMCQPDWAKGCPESW